MKGLLLKDFYVAVKQCRMHLVLMLLLLVLSVMGDGMMTFMLFPCVLGGMLPMTLLSYDERSHWSDYCGTMPCTRRDVVSAKFIVALTVQGVLLLLTLLVQGLRMAVVGAVDGGLLLLYAGLFCAASSVSAVMLPLSFKFGVEKGNVAYYLLVGVICAVNLLLSPTLENTDTVLSGSGIALGLMAVAAVLYTLCWRLSIRFYEKRERGKLQMNRPSSAAKQVVLARGELYHSGIHTRISPLCRLPHAK